jgi:hypothetical protein
MAEELLRTLLEQLEAIRSALTRPGFGNMLVVFVGWVLTTGPHAVTQALVVTAVAGRRHHEAFHRFFSRGTWQPDEIGRILFFAVVRLLPEGAAIRAVVDDTLAPKKGPHVFGIGSHLDAVRSTRKFRAFSFGHCWVVLAVLVPLPFSTRAWALPVLFRLYRNKQECAAQGHRYQKKTELARQMVNVLRGWVGSRRVELTADSAYCNGTVTHDLPPSVVLLGAMRPDAVLTELPAPASGKRPGRPRKRGRLLPKPQHLARDEHHPWKTCQATLYGRRQQVRYKECRAQWYRACGTCLLRIVVVAVSTGTIQHRVFFSTDATMTVVQILEGYAGRWSIEVTFKDLKQLLGFADSSARKKEAVERTAPFVGLTFTILVVWFAEHAHRTPLAAPPARPWYTHKRGSCFADVLRTAQRVLSPLDVLASGRTHDNLHQILSPAAAPSARRLRRAA